MKKSTICPIFTLPLAFLFFLAHTSTARGTSSGLCRRARPGDMPLTWAWSHGGELRGRGGVSPDSLSKWLIAPNPPRITLPHPTLPPLPRTGRGPSASFLCGSETKITSGRGCVEQAGKGAESYHGVHELDAALQLRPGVTVLTEQQPANRLLLAQTGVVPLCTEAKQQQGKRRKRHCYSSAWIYSDSKCTCQHAFRICFVHLRNKYSDYR